MISTCIFQIFYYKKKVEEWAKNNRLEAILLSLILILGAFLRLYRIDEYMTFLGDEGRDALVVRRLLVNFDPILIGPRTSIGDMYLGPLYYYLMAPFLLLANFSPVGPAVMVALIGVATIFLVWWIAREYLGSIAAFSSSFLYAISPVVIIYSRSSWNPNIMPFFALLCIYALFKIWDKKEYQWLIILGISYAFVLQSHYLGLLLFPTISLFIFIVFTQLIYKKYFGFSKSKQNSAHDRIRFFFKNLFWGSLIFIVLMSPLVIFDARHDWRNFSSMKRFFTERELTISARPWTGFPELPQVLSKMLTRVVGGMNETVGKPLGYLFIVLSFAIFFLLIYKFRKKRTLDQKFRTYFLLLVWMWIGLEGLALYKQEIYDHYYGFIYPAPFLFIGGLLQTVSDFFAKKFILLRIFVYFWLLAAFLLLTFVNFQKNPLKYAPNRQLQRTEEVAKKILKESNGERFNFAVIAERNYEGAYQYFLEKFKAPMVEIDPQRASDTITENLFVVCELPKESCDPVHSSKAEIANFGWSRVDQMWEVSGVILYRLTHLR